MARQVRITPPGVSHHVVQRGNNRQSIFRCDRDFYRFAGWLAQYARQCDVSIHAWVFMTNHVHLLVTPEQENGLSTMMQAIGRQYVRYFNRRYERTGTLFEGRFKSCMVESNEYLLACYRYIEENPIRARLVKFAGNYPWSSYGHNAWGNFCAITTPHSTYLGLGKTGGSRQAAYRRLFKQQLSFQSLEEIRNATGRGHPFGSDAFKDNIESSFSCRVRPGQRGRPGSF